MHLYYPIFVLCSMEVQNVVCALLKAKKVGVVVLLTIHLLAMCEVATSVLHLPWTGFSKINLWY